MIMKTEKQEAHGMQGALTHFGRAGVPPPVRRYKQALRAALPQEPQVRSPPGRRNCCSRNSGTPRMRPVRPAGTHCRRVELHLGKVPEARGGEVSCPQNCPRTATDEPV